MRDITVTELKQRMDAGEELYVLDVREPEEYAEFNIGAKLLPLGNILRMDTEEIDGWKDKEVILHCRSGKRSLQAALFLETLGFADVRNLTGGMLAWKEQING